MSTRARIGIENENGKVTSIYTHSDGYPDHHWPVLTEHYNTEEKVRALLALGDLSWLGESIGEKHDFGGENYEWCLAYGRDRGETGTEAETHESIAWPDGGQYYEYLFRRGAWLWRPHGEKTWRSIHTATDGH